jgi:hypothetical protein
VIRGSLVIEPAPDGAPGLVAIYCETGPPLYGRMQLRGPVSIVSRAVHIDLLDATARFRPAMCLFLPGALANVLARVMSGATFVDANPQPAATRIVMIRVPEAMAARLEL